MKSSVVTSMKTSVTKFGILLFFGSAVALSAVDVTLQVNMAVQISAGNFNPSTHTVEVHGSFNGWGPGIGLLPSATDANIYKGTITVSSAPGTQVQYKFVMNQGGTLVWENNGVGASGAQNRQFDVPASDQTLAE